LGSILLFLTGFVLLGFAITAYIVFYFNYIPIRGFSQPIYLQFEPDKHPFANFTLRRGMLVTEQPYDVTVNLHMPRTTSNREAGNFMLSLQLFSPDDSGTGVMEKLVAQARRPTIMTYYSPAMDLANKAAGLPLYVLGWRHESEALGVELMERVEFARGWRNIPTTARVELQSQAALQVYSAEIVFKARLRGLR
jgi:seipin